MLRKCVMITGCNRGLGLEFVRQLAEGSLAKPSLIVATCRNPDEAKELVSVANNQPNLIHVEPLDLKDLSSLPSFVRNVQGKISEAGGLSCLINNAGVSPRAARYNRVTMDQMADTFAVNTTGPLLLSRELLDVFTNPGLIVNMSSYLGSIELNRPNSGTGSPGGLYPYRASKAALNIISRSMAFDFQHLGVASIAVHPGWVKTRLGGSHAPMEPKDSISAILRFINDDFDPQKHNGEFVDYAGKKVPF